MNKKILIIPLILIITCQLMAQESMWAPSVFRSQPFREFVSTVQPLLKVKFFYKSDWVKDLKMGDYPDTFSLKDVLDNLFLGTSIYYYIDRHGNVVLTKDYQVRFSTLPGDTASSFLQPSDLTGREEISQGKGNIFLEIGNPADRDKAGKATISGYIKDHDTGEPLAGVTILDQKLSVGAISNEFGFYTLKLSRGIHTLQFSFLGMKEKNINLNLYGDGELNIEMNSRLIPLKETVISAQKKMVLQRFETGVEKISLTSLRLSPATLGESNIVSSLLLVPGVKSVGEGSAGFNVRGGSADQNLILLYGAPVYNSSHFFGFFSAVNPDIIKDLTLYKGGIPSRFGGRISSVLEIGTAEGNKKEFEGNAGISPVTTHLTIEGPLKKDTLSYILSFRNTYSNWILRLIPFAGLNRSRASFFDINGKITYDLNKSDKIEAASYFSHDAFRLGADSLYRYENHIIALKWRHLFSSRFISAFSLYNSFSGYNITSDMPRTESFVLLHKLNNTGIKADFNWFRDRSEINFGLDLNGYGVLPGAQKPANDSSLISRVTIEKEKALEASLYIDDKFTLTDFLSVSAGIRISSYYSLGPSSVFVYREGFSKSSSSIVDTLNFKPFEVSKVYAGPEIRMSLNFRTSDHNSLKINYNRTRQYLHLLSNTTSISPTDTWKLSDYNIRPQIGDQVALGFYQMLANNRVEASVEVYYKKLEDMADFKGGANLVMNERIQEEIVNVKGRAYGLELLLKKSEGKVQFDIGYTYARTFIKSPSVPREEIINEGRWFPANFDKPHDLFVTVNCILTRRFSIAANYTWSTGRPVTFPVATYIMYNDVLVHYSDRNKYRIPDYSRLDLSIKLGGSLRVRQIAHPSWTFSVYNLLGRNNVYSIFFKKEGDFYKGYKISVFAQAIPSVTFSFDF
ncbi:MAG: TonB-dependent receptor [Bacteroidota bacterium]|nr:TonB-dependent receptor [Bacteroidota bacterium]